MELQADPFLPARPQLMEFPMEKDQDKENSPPFLAGISPMQFPALQVSERQPLQEITHLFATNADTQSINIGRGMPSVVEMRGPVEQTSSIQNKKINSTNLPIDRNTSLSNLRRPLLRTEFR